MIGSKYDETRGLNLTQVAKLIRADLAAAKETGTVPGAVTISVRTEYASIYDGFRVRIKGCADAWLYNKGATAATIQYARYTAEAADLLNTVKKICLAYQRTNFQLGGDYYYERFHLNATYVDEDEAQCDADARHHRRAKKIMKNLREAGRLTISEADGGGERRVSLDGESIGTLSKTARRDRWGAYRHDGTGFVHAHLDDAVYYLLPGKNPPRPPRPTHPARFGRK